MEAVLIILAIMSPALLAILSHLVLSLRKGPGGKEATKLRGDLESLRRDYAQLKADHTDMLLSLEKAVHRLDARVDKMAGIDAPPPEPPRREPPQRQL